MTIRGRSPMQIRRSGASLVDATGAVASLSPELAGHTGSRDQRQPATRPRALFLGKTFAGWSTRFSNLQANMRADGRLRTEFRSVTGWQESGSIERLRFVPRSVRGRTRACLEAAVFTRRPRPDVIWTSALESVAPYLVTQLGPGRRPLVLEIDWTFEQQEEFAEEYFGRAPRSGMPHRLGRMREQITFAAADRIVTMSHWAADSLRRQGVDESKVVVIHPGLDLDLWQPMARVERPSGTPIRLLFVGGDFDRKGGPQLLELFSARYSDTCELDIVTTAPIEARPGVRIHRLGPNAGELRRLYQQADVFVLPTRAECFGHAAVEALASGVPVIISDIGGTRDIVEEGQTGWLIGRTEGELAAAIDAALDSPGRLREMGQAARRRAERLFDGPANDRRLADLLLSLTAK